MIDDHFVNHELESILLKTIKQDIPPAMNRKVNKGGYFSSIRLIICYIDVFGFLYTGRSNSDSAVKFIRDYFGRFYFKYGEIPGLIYSIYRHGTIHIFKPKYFIINNRKYANIIGKELDLVNSIDNTKFQFRQRFGDTVFQHLIPINVKPITYPKNFDTSIENWFPCSLPKLYNDLLSSVEAFINDIKINSELNEIVQQSIRKYRKYHEFKLNKSKEVIEISPIENKRNKRKYISFHELSKW